MDRKGVLFIILVVFPMVSQSGENKCKNRDLERAYQSSVKIKKLSDVKKYYIKFRKCTGGYVAEAYSESISKLLDKNWDEVVGSKNINDRDVLEGLLMGISDVWEYNMSQRILKNAKDHCLKEAKKLCDAIINSDPLKK